LLDEFLGMFSATADVLPPIGTFLIILLTMFAIGIGISFTYMKTDKNGAPSQSFALTLVILPVIVTIIIMLVGSNVARAFSLGGAFAIIRFRSVAGDPKDIAYVLFCMAVGLAGGMGFLLYSVCIAVLLCLIMLVLYLARYAVPKKTRKLLKITIPEDFNYQHAFDDILERYASHTVMSRVRTTDLGSLFELSYTITMPDTASEKDMLDELRSRNGNLPITLVLEAQNTEYLS